jgi:hypothetical protein
MATLSYQNTVRDARLDALTSALGSSAYLEIFTGSSPGKTSGTFNADAGTKLASLACSNPTAPGSSAGVLTFSAITAGTALASGTPGYARFKTAQNGTASTVIIELDAAVGSGSLNFSSTINSGGTVSITSATITEGNN